MVEDVWESRLRGAAETVFDGDPVLRSDYLAVDWAATALGVPETWPASLRTTVGLMLRSRFAMWMCWGPDLTFFCNDAYRRDTLGIKYPWALGRPSAEVWAEIWDDVTPLVDRVMHGESTWDESLMLFLQRHGYPEESYHTFSYSPLLDDGVIKGLFCVVSEVTGKVVSERRISALRDLSGALAAARTEAEVFAAAREQLHGDPYDLPFAAVYLLDGDTARLACLVGADAGDPAFPERLGTRGRPGDGSAAAPPWAAQLPAPGLPLVLNDLAASAGRLPTGAWEQPPNQAVSVALVHPSDDGLDGFLVVGTSPHRRLDADYIGFVELVAGQLASAVTRGRAYDDEQRRLVQLAELDRAKTTFFTNVSHELRTPLTLLLGPVADALADSTAPLDGRQRTRLEYVARNGERLLKLVNTLLDFSRLESGKVQAGFAATDLATLTTELAAMFDSAFASAGLSLQVDCPALPEPTWVDREMWSKIVLNLLSNALKATFTGGVTVRLRAAGGTAVLEVADTGTGIPAAEQDRLFERFHRVSGAAQRSHEGSGIGLALVAELAALHGGAVHVASEVGVGSTFSVEVPLGRDHLPAGSVLENAPAQAVASGYAGHVAEALRWLREDPDDVVEPVDDDGRPTVLVVDDNADMRGYVVSLLADEYAVRTATDGAAALEVARAAPPDLVLTDIMMPVLDGFGLLAALRADPATLHIPVVMLSARSGDDSAVEGLEAGADDYLVKPFSQRELLARVRANLELDRVRRVAGELERSRELVASAEALARVGSFDYDIAADRLVGTEEFYRLLGVTAADVERGGFAVASQRVHPADREITRQRAQHSLATGDPLETVFRVGDEDDAITVWFHGIVQLDDAGRPERMVGTAQDITDRVAAEQAERAAAAAGALAAREHEIASELQASLLPRRHYDADHLDVAGFYRAGVAGTQVGGDWYDVLEQDAGRTGLVLGDVMGRGVQAAAVMGQLRATMRAYARLELAPDTVLHLLDDAVRDISDDMIVTCVYAVYDPTDQSLTYANAGHLPPLLTVPGEGTRRLTAGGPPLGVGRAWGRPETVAMPTGATVTLYTDGLVEQRGSDLDDGIDRVARLVDAASGPIDELPGMLTGTLLAGGADDQDDDVAVVVARVSERATGDRVASMPVESELAAVAAARDFAGSQLTGWGVPAGLVDDARLIVSELVTNAIVHGAPPVELRVRLGGGRVLLESLDSAITTPQLRRAKPTEDNGRGLLIVSMLAERWGTRPTQNGKSVWCQLRVR